MGGGVAIKGRVYLFVELANISILVRFPLLEFAHVLVTRAGNQSSQQTISKDVLENPDSGPSHPTFLDGENLVCTLTPMLLTPDLRSQQRQEHGGFLGVSRHHLDGLE